MCSMSIEPRLPANITKMWVVIYHYANTTISNKNRGNRKQNIHADYLLIDWITHV